MERKLRGLERDIKRFYSDSEQIPKQLLYLKDFHTNPESWDMCMSILAKHAVNTDRITKMTVPVLMYCASTLRVHAYEGFRQHFHEEVPNKYLKIWEICEKVLKLFVAYAKGHPRISLQLSAVVACAVIYGFEPTQSASRLLFLIALARTGDRTLPQYLYLSSVAKEATGPNVSITLNQRCAFIRTCVSLSPKIFPKVVAHGKQCDLSIDHLRMTALTDWLHMHIYLLKVFYPVAIEQKFLDSYEMVYEDLMLPRKKVSDLALLHGSLNTLNSIDTVEMVLNFIKYGIAAEDERIMQSACELASHLLYICRVDLSSLLIMANQKCSELLEIRSQEDRWAEACRYTLSRFSQVILKITADFALGICKIASELLECGEPDKKMRFLRPYTSKWLLDLFINMANEHLPLVLHFGLVKQHYIHNFCKFVNLYMYSDTFAFRKSALDFWEVLQSHLCPPRKDLSYITTCALENMRERSLKAIRPCFESFVGDLYRSSTISEGDDFEALSLYRDLVDTALKRAVLVTGPGYVLKMIRRDMDFLSRELRPHILELCVFLTSVMATRLTDSADVVSSVVSAALDMLELKKVKIKSSHPVNFYRNTVFRLILWTSGLIVKDEKLLARTTKILCDQIKIAKSSNQDLSTHVYMDQAVLGLCFSLPQKHQSRGTFIDHLSCSIANYVAPIEKRIEIIEAFLVLVDALPSEESLHAKHSMIKSFYYQVCHVSRLGQMLESRFLLLALMSAINFVDHGELNQDLMQHLIQFLVKFRDTEEMWQQIADLLSHTTFTDQSHADFSTNRVQNNKTSFVFWLLASSTPGFIQLCLIRVLLASVIRGPTKLYEVTLKNLVHIATQYMGMLKSDLHPADHHAIELLDCLNLVMTKWQLAGALFEWKELPEFITVLSNSLPRRLSNLNHSGYSLIAKFVGWADFPKQLITNIERAKYRVFKETKTRVRSILEKREKGSRGNTILYNIVDAIVRAAITRAEQMDAWITYASQTLAVLTRCTQLFNATQASLKGAMEERCLDMTQAHINFYHRKIIEARGSNDIRFLLTIISDFHTSKFTLY